MTNKTLGVIGTAGRDKSKPMTAKLFDSMCFHLWEEIEAYGKPINLVSGGAAWADHVAVAVWLKLVELGHPNVGKLTLHLPAPWDWERTCYQSSKCGDVSNHYFNRMEQTTGVDHRAELQMALGLGGCHFDNAPPTANMAAFFQRNKLVAQESDFLLAYTWGCGDAPDDGGTADTWHKCRGERVHVPLVSLQG